MIDNPDAFSRIFPEVTLLAEKALLRLLQEKHLYQSVELRVEDLSASLEELANTQCDIIAQIMPFGGGGGPRVPHQSKEEMIREYTGQADSFLRNIPYFIKKEGGGSPLAKPSRPLKGCFISVPTVRTFCNHPDCEGVWPHNQCPDPSYLIPSSLSGEDQQQVFVLRYQCQNCKRDPVTFLVKRDGRRLTLTGREPIEAIEIPRYVPKQVRKYYQGAVLAFNCGAQLPALFMLRTTIEQYMRHATNAGQTRISGDALADAYAQTLHSDFNSRYQSLKPVYLALSDAIHSARDHDQLLFQSEQEKVLKHFEAKEMFERLSANG